MMAAGPFPAASPFGFVEPLFILDISTTGAIIKKLPERAFPVRGKLFDPSRPPADATVLEDTMYRYYPHPTNPDIRIVEVSPGVWQEWNVVTRQWGAMSSQPAAGVTPQTMNLPTGVRVPNQSPPQTGQGWPVGRILAAVGGVAAIVVLAAAAIMGANHLLQPQRGDGQSTSNLNSDETKRAAKKGNRRTAGKQFQLANGQIVTIRGLPSGEDVTQNLLFRVARCDSGSASVEAMSGPPKGAKSTSKKSRWWHVVCDQDV